MIPDISGKDSVVGFFGEWPSFHDAEIVSVHIHRGQSSSIRIRTLKLSDQLDAQGRYVIEREAVVVFECRGIRSLRLEGEDADRQNVIQGIDISQTPEGFRIELAPCYGLSGDLVVRELSVKLDVAS